MKEAKSTNTLKGVKNVKKPNKIIYIYIYIYILVAALIGCSSSEQNQEKIKISNLQVESTINFGEVRRNSQSPIITLNVLNDENNSVQINPSLAGTDFQIVYSNCGELKKGKACSLKILMKTDTVGVKEDILSINSNSVELTGEVVSSVAINSLKITEDSQEISDLNFLVVNGQKIKTLTVKNEGDALESVPSIDVVGNFSIINNSCTKILKKNATCSLKILFDSKGKVSGEHEGTLILNEEEISLLASVESIIAPQDNLVFVENGVEVETVDLGQITGNLIKNIIIQNKNLSPSSVLEVELDSPNYVKLFDSCSGKSLNGNSTCLVKVYLGELPNGNYPLNLSVNGSNLEVEATVVDSQQTGCISGEHEEEGVCVPNIRACTPDELLGIGSNAIAGTIEWEDENQSYGYCQVSECSSNFSVNSIYNSCVETQISCLILPENANSGFQDFNESSSSYDECQIQDCSNGYSLFDNQCYETEISCDPLPFGADIATQEFSSGSYGTCQIASCSSGFSLDGNSCVENQEMVPVAMIKQNNNTRCYLNAEGKAYCWGNNLDGIVGNGVMGTSHVASYVNSPTPVVTSGALNGKTLVDISIGRRHVCALDSLGVVYCWGMNIQGELGINSTTSSAVPVAVNTDGVLSGKKIVSIFAFSDHSCAIDENGDAYCWGANNRGLLCDGSTINVSTPSSILVPVAVSKTGSLSGKKIVKIVSTQYSTHILDDEGGLHACGANAGYGLLGTGLSDSSFVSTSVSMTVFNSFSIKEIASTNEGLCVINDIGVPYCIGLEIGYSFGLSGYSVRISPTIAFGTGDAVGKVFDNIDGGSGQSTFCLTESITGDLYCANNNSNGSKGDGRSSGQITGVGKVKNTGVLSGKTIVGFAAGNTNGYAIDSDGIVYGWGNVSGGTLGNGMTNYQIFYEPIVIPFP